MAFLTAKERDTLYILCNTLIPSLEPEDGDDETLFQLAASDLNVSEEFETAFERVTSAKQQREFKLLLHLLENGFVNGVLAGQWCPTSGMRLEARE